MWDRNAGVALNVDEVLLASQDRRNLARSLQMAEARAKLPAGCRCPSPRTARGHEALRARQCLHLVFQQLLLCSWWTPSRGKRSLQ